MAASADDLINELRSLLPAPLNVLPQTLREVVEEAIRLAEAGDMEMILAVSQSMREVSAAMHNEHETDSPSLCSAEAEQYMAEIDRSLEVDELRSAVERVLELDPHAVEAMIMLGDLAADREQRAAWYQQAAEAVQHKDPADVRVTMPHLRKHMGLSLVEAGLLSDAAEILLPAIQEDPTDPAGCRYPLLDVCLRLGWHDEVARIVANFPEDPLGPIDFAAAILAYAVQGDSADAQTLLTAAIRRHPGVAEYLLGAKQMPRVGEPITPAAEQRVTAAEFLLPSLREVEGTSDWIRHLWMEIAEDVAANADDDGAGAADAPADDERELLAFAKELHPQDTSWLMYSEKSKTTGEYVVIIMDDDDLLTARTFTKRPRGEELRPLLLAGIDTPAVGQPRKPHTLVVPTKVMAKSLAGLCEAIDVAVLAEKPSKELRQELKPIIEMIAQSFETATDEDQAAAIESLQDLPMKDQIWLYGLFRPPMWVSEGPVPTRPYQQLVLDLESGLIVHQHLTQTLPTMNEMAQQLCRAMTHPMCGKPRQVQALLVDPGMVDDRQAIDEDTLAMLDQTFPETQIMPGDEQIKQGFDRLIAEMLQMHGPVSSAIRNLEDMNDARMAEFYQILANFYRAKPWNMVGGDQIFEIQCEAWSPARWAACVMGQLGQEFGIALYDDPAVATQMLEDPDPTFEGIDTLVVHFNEAFDAVPVDCWYRERNNWALAGPEAHPFVARFSDGELKAIERQDVDVIMQTLPHIPRFFDHPADQSLTVGEGPQQINFRWTS
ncbi:tetratricopeptide repeat protein [Roseimaritima ulvae]|uniref:DUF7309 domain-containing protein n=1 Tax=Roseimaritima ulvae TaxID=980254 RepID=A0A5B9R152_9BACT|nr:hypothetical protein [Roseimaritima ulvae]QEG39931.1 hypothetical protein UC8_19330 [Roseimaritima ulvae]